MNEKPPLLLNQELGVRAQLLNCILCGSPERRGIEVDGQLHGGGA
jgi:hypothetical protein